MNEMLANSNENQTSEIFSSKEFATKVEKLTYEQARQELINIVNKLESSNLQLQESINLWKKGEILVTKCRNFLDRYQNEIDEKLKKDNNDN